MRKTKIVCTLGPASDTPEMLDQLIEAGMNVARLNFSHGSHEQHRETYRRVREAAERSHHEVAILQDLQGPKIRVGLLEGGRMELSQGQSVVVQPGERQSAPGSIPTTYAALPRDARAGDTILMDDGLLRLRVEGVDGEQVRCRVEVGGVLKDRKGINLPGVSVSAPALTDKDLVDLKFGAELGVDFVSLSFVRHPDDVLMTKKRLAEAGSNAPVIAKIEKPEAVDTLDEICSVADGIMVARGDLGVEMGPEKVPLLQKRAIEVANHHGKLVITATQMLESMVHNAFPTRAEASDVANAVLDQTDAVMLSGETAAGEYPVLTVQTMARIIDEVEKSDLYRRIPVQPPRDLTVSNCAVAHAAATAAQHLGARAILCVSGNGGTPRLVSDYRPEMPVYALSKYRHVLHRLAAYWGVHPVYFERASTVDETVSRIDAMLLDRGLAERGDVVVVTMVVPPESGEHTNAMKVHVVGR
ncbi:MAG: pyruvate kinase [bacterium]